MAKPLPTKPHLMPVVAGVLAHSNMGRGMPTDNEVLRMVDHCHRRKVHTAAEQITTAGEIALDFLGAYVEKAEHERYYIAEGKMFCREMRRMGKTEVMKCWAHAVQLVERVATANNKMELQ